MAVLGLDHVVNFFKNVGHLIAHALGLVKEHIPESLMQLAVQYVEHQAGLPADNSDKREQVVAQLITAGYAENPARAAAELAVMYLKDRADTL